MGQNARTWSLLATAGIVMFAAGHWSGRLDQSSFAAAQDPGAGAMDEETMKMIAAGTPGEQHKMLATLAGEYDIAARMWMGPDMAPMSSNGTMTREMVMDGRYLKETVQATDMNGEMNFHGVGIIAYDNVDQHFETVWYDTMSTGLMSDSGTFNPQSKTFNMHGTFRDPATGVVMHVRGQLDVSNPDRQIMQSFTTGPDGVERKTFEAVAERKKN